MLANVAYMQSAFGEDAIGFVGDNGCVERDERPSLGCVGAAVFASPDFHIAAGQQTGTSGQPHRTQYFTSRETLHYGLPSKKRTQRNNEWIRSLIGEKPNKDLFLRNHRVEFYGRFLVEIEITSPR